MLYWTDDSVTRRFIFYYPFLWSITSGKCIFPPIVREVRSQVSSTTIWISHPSSLFVIWSAWPVPRLYNQNTNNTKYTINSSVCLNTVMSNIMILQCNLTTLQHHIIKNILQIHGLVHTYVIILNILNFSKPLNSFPNFAIFNYGSVSDCVFITSDSRTILHMRLFQDNPGLGLSFNRKKA